MDVRKPSVGADRLRTSYLISGDNYYCRMQLPPALYCVRHEASYTRPSFVKAAGDPKYSADRHFAWKHISTEAIEQSLSPTTPGFSHVSIWGSLKLYAARCFQGHMGDVPRRRITVAEVKTTNLSPIIFQPAGPETQVPVWIPPFNSQGLALKSEFQNTRSEHHSNYEVFMSVDEIRIPLRLAHSVGSAGEWLVCGGIKPDRLGPIMPFDGEKVHREQGTAVVRCEGWEFDWSSRSWIESKSPEQQDLIDILKELSNLEPTSPRHPELNERLRDVLYRKAQIEDKLAARPARKLDDENTASGGPSQAQAHDELKSQDTQKLLKEVLVELRKLNHVLQLQDAPSLGSPHTYPVDR